MNALATIAAAVCLRTPLIGIRCSRPASQTAGAVICRRGRERRRRLGGLGGLRRLGGFDVAAG